MLVYVCVSIYAFVLLCNQAPQKAGATIFSGEVSCKAVKPLNASISSFEMLFSRRVRTCKLRGFPTEGVGGIGVFLGTHQAA